DHLDRLDGLAERDGEGWLPPVDVYETPDRYIVTAELPGMDHRDIKIDAREEGLSLRGRRPDAGIPPHAYHRIERGQGPFERRFVFAEPIDVEQIAAEFHDGVLAITIPKLAARRITLR
ncbi:MAG: Hsp20/alpha crystallin family protein, partial [Vicinamibacterales bacterium]